jgi:HAD superfamily hydrolase (TIGR01549 family)
MLAIFDLDGTIIDTKEEIYETFFQAFKNVGLELDKRNLERYIGLPLKELLEALLGKYDRRVEEEIRKVYYSERERKIRVFPGLEEIIKTDKIKKGILTSKRRKTAIYDMQYLGILQYFPVLMCADDLERKKPDGEGILKIMELTDCQDKNRVFMVGDTEMDILSAKHAGVKSVAVTWGFRDENFLKKYEPDYIVRTPQDLKKLLLGF